MCFTQFSVRVKNSKREAAATKLGIDVPDYSPCTFNDSADALVRHGVCLNKTCVVDRQLKNLLFAYDELAPVDGGWELHDDSCVKIDCKWIMIHESKSFARPVAPLSIFCALQTKRHISLQALFFNFTMFFLAIFQFFRKHIFLFLDDFKRRNL